MRLLESWRPICLGLGALAAVGWADPAAATTYTFGVSYYTIAGTYNGAGSGDPDFNTIGCCTATFTDEVTSSLGPHGLPVYNTASSAPTIHDVNGSGEITWWSPSMNPFVTATGTGTLTTQSNGIFSNHSLFPPNGTGGNDGSGFQGLIVSGVIHLASAQSVSFTVGADDDAFLYVDGTVATQEGGIHGVSDAPVDTSTLAAGDHTFELFYVDRNVTGAGLDFGIASEDLVVNPVPPTPPTTPVPEPGSLLLFSAGLLGLGATRRWKKR